jgi:GNAT superfamily N-acetyltransferase
VTKLEIEIQSVSGAELEPHLPDLAALRIEVFREYPYLYEGTHASEARYLRSYSASARSVIALARAGEAIVGASTAMPLEEHGESVAEPLAAAGFDPARVYYFGESVLRASYRGHGLGHAFFDLRERAARLHGFGVCAFCAVLRPTDHPLRPSDYHPHDAFWTKRGYRLRPDIVASFAWKDIDQAAETAKPMQFWVRELE